MQFGVYVPPPILVVSKGFADATIEVIGNVQMHAMAIIIIRFLIFFIDNSSKKVFLAFRLYAINDNIRHYSL